MHVRPNRRTYSQLLQPDWLMASTPLVSWPATPHTLGACGLQGTCLRISLEDGCLLEEVAHRGVSMRRQDLDPNLISPGFAQLLSLDRPVAVLVLPARSVKIMRTGGLCASGASAESRQKRARHG